MLARSTRPAVAVAETDPNLSFRSIPNAGNNMLVMDKLSETAATPIPDMLFEV